MEMEIDEIFDWNVEKLDAALKELNVVFGTDWTKTKKARELDKAIEKMRTKDVEDSKVSSDPSMLILKRFSIDARADDQGPGSC